MSKLDSRDWETSFPRTCLNVAPGISNIEHLPFLYRSVLFFFCLPGAYPSATWVCKRLSHHLFCVTPRPPSPLSCDRGMIPQHGISRV